MFFFLFFFKQSHRAQALRHHTVLSSVLYALNKFSVIYSNSCMNLSRKPCVYIHGPKQRPCSASCSLLSRLLPFPVHTVMGEKVPLVTDIFLLLCITHLNHESVLCYLSTTELTNKDTYITICTNWFVWQVRMVKASAFKRESEDV